MKVILAPSFEIAQSLHTPTVTVEAEYGSQVWEGSLYTAAHHQSAGPYAGRHVVTGGRPSPCNDRNIPDLANTRPLSAGCEEGIHIAAESATVGVSHIDLDTIGGVLRTWGVPLFTEAQQSFWDLAEFVDVQGAHRLTEADATCRDEANLWAFWAWKEKNVKRFNPDTFTDVTPLVTDAWKVLTALLDRESLESSRLGLTEQFIDRTQLIEAGIAYKKAQAELSLDTLVQIQTADVFIRCSHQFVNHLYTAELVAGDTSIAQAIVAFNPRYGSVAISLATPVEGVNCCEIVQALWGPEAGGHPGIAGSPRGRRLFLSDVQEAAEAISNALLA